ncbi:hypothetical protein ABZ079_15210 [Streptomyces sp. NPDC006314]
MLAVASTDHEDTAQRPPTREPGLSLLCLVGTWFPRDRFTFE